MADLQHLQKQVRNRKIATLASAIANNGGTALLLDAIDQLIAHLRGIPKGDKGDVGPAPSDAKLLSLIRPLIPKISDGKTPTEAELLVLIRRVMPPPVPGETPSDAKLLSLIRPLIPPPQKGDPGDPADEESLFQRILARLPRVETVRSLPTISLFGGNAGAKTLEVWMGTTPIGQDIRKIIFEGTALSVVRAGDGVAIVTGTGGSGGGANVSTEKLTPTDNGDGTVNLDLTGLAHTFLTVQWISKNGQILDPSDTDFGWSTASTHATVKSAAVTDIFMVAYTY